MGTNRVGATVNLTLEAFGFLACGRHRPIREGADGEAPLAPVSLPKIVDDEGSAAGIGHPAGEALDRVVIEKAVALGGTRDLGAYPVGEVHRGSCPYPVRTRDGLACRTVATAVCLCQCISADGRRVFALSGRKACPYKGMGIIASDGLKICTSASRVPVRIRARPPRTPEISRGYDGGRPSAGNGARGGSFRVPVMSVIPLEGCPARFPPRLPGPIPAVAPRGLAAAARS